MSTLCFIKEGAWIRIHNMTGLLPSLSTGVEVSKQGFTCTSTSSELFIVLLFETTDRAETTHDRPTNCSLN